MIWAFVNLCPLKASGLHLPEWKNPGGMFTPEQLLGQKDLLRKLGLKIPVEGLSDPASSRLQSVVSLGHCSGSFVSENGLIITNHHCVRGMLSWLTNEDKKTGDGHETDYMINGFQAKNRLLERNGGPAERIYVTLSEQDVTRELTCGLHDTHDPLRKAQLIEERVKAIIAREEASGKHILAEVRSFYRDASFMLIRKLELKDVRLVFAPPRAVGFYGGKSDNWSWPRHTGDFAFIRAYVGPDGRPRSYHRENIPYRPINFLRVANSRNGWAKDQDLVLVAGYPGSTNRLDTAEQIESEMKEQIPWLHARLRSLRALLGKLGEEDGGLRKKLSSKLFSMDNYLKNQSRTLEALESLRYLEKKRTNQKAFLAWIHADQERFEKWGQVTESLEAIRQEWQQGWQRRSLEADLLSGFSAGLSHILASAIDIVRMAEERPLEDIDRHPDYQQRRWSLWIQREQSAQRRYDRRIAVTVMIWALNRALSQPDREISEAVWHILNREQVRTNPNHVREAVKQLFESTSMEQVAQRIHWFQKASLEDLNHSDDPFIRLALRLTPAYKALENHKKATRGAYLASNQRYIAALKAWMHAQGQTMPPDANSSLRITFGHVHGYTRLCDQKWQAPFTNLLDLISKHKPGSEEFEVPCRLLRKVIQRKFEPFTEGTFGNVPMNFLASVDTTGGNSGSPAMNASGELIGLLFDGNKDSLYGDYYFDSKVRSILLDIRYAGWYLRSVAKNKRLLREIGLL